MALKIIRSNESIKVENITTTIYSLPGVGKSSLAFSAEKVLDIDTDNGSYRAANRGDVVRPKSWEEIRDIERGDVEGYSALALDTVGRTLDMLSVFLIDQDPKLSRKSGDLSLQGFGALKSAFKAWNDKIHSFGLDVILISHMDEKESDGVVKERFDIQGGSRSEIYKSSDAICKLYIDAKGRRMLDFSPREGALGKNPAGFNVIPVPDLKKEPQFFADVMAKIKSSLNAMSEEQKDQHEKDERVRGLFAACQNVTDFNAVLGELRGTSDAIKEFALKRAVENGLTFSKEQKCFVEAGKPTEKPQEQPKAQKRPEPPPEQSKPVRSQESAEKGHSGTRPKKPITKAQISRLWAIGLGHGKDRQAVTNILGRYGFEHVDDVTMDQYDNICKDLEDDPAPPVNDDQYNFAVADEDVPF